MDRARIKWWLALGLAAIWQVGCVEGPFGGFAPINPWLHRQWAEDEKYTPTFHRRLAELRDLRGEAPRLTPQQMDALAADLEKQLATEPSPVLRAEMTSLLGEMGTPQALATIRSIFADADRDVRIAACKAWAKTNTPETITVLSELIKQEQDVDVRLAAIAELGRFPDPTAVAALGEALDDNNPAVQHLAVQSLKAATGRDYGDSVPAWRDFVQGREPTPPPTPSLVERMTKMF